MRLIARLLPFLALLALVLGPDLAFGDEVVRPDTAGKFVIACPSVGASAATTLGTGDSGYYVATAVVEMVWLCVGATTCGKDAGVNGLPLAVGVPIRIWASGKAVSCYSDGNTGVLHLTRYTRQR